MITSLASVPYSARDTSILVKFAFGLILSATCTAVFVALSRLARVFPVFRRLSFGKISLCTIAAQIAYIIEEHFTPP